MAQPGFEDHGWPSRKVRSTFIEYFRDKQAHDYVPSSSVVPHEDPTLLFTNAGMNQFKAIFLGQADPSSSLAKLQRAVNSQKCIRAGGKHNDLDDVGKDTYHHTFFEMLGNWSFGNYFKKEAITWAFELLTKVYGLDPNRLYATYFKGLPEAGVPADEEAKEMWSSLLPKERVLPYGAKENFWEMGDVGPCGPCTEIHYDRIGGRDASAMVNADDPNVIEIWNVVFIQYSREPDGSLKTLPAKHVDTGMGFERLTSILQKKSSNYDTDVFVPIFEKIQAMTGAPAYTGHIGKQPNVAIDTAYRVLADHIRTLSFAIADGALPSNEGRGYVLRRILRRAVRYGSQFLHAKPGFFAELVPTLVKHMGDVYPELVAHEKLITDVLTEEESSFNRTLVRGLAIFAKFADASTASGSNVISGPDAFFLYDTMGFPLDLTQIMAEERGMKVDIDGYKATMEQARERSRADRARGSALAGGVGGRLVLEAEQTDALRKTMSLARTDESLKYVWHKAQSAKVCAIFGGSNIGFVKSVEELVSKLGTDAAGVSVPFGLVLDRTSFYAEAGGQVADTGRMYMNVGSLSAEWWLDVVDVQVFGGYVLHVCVIAGEYVAGKTKEVIDKSVVVGSEVELRVDYERRAFIAPNHTMTHVLNYALRSVLKESSDQRGSLVDANKLRFDFAYNKAMTAEQIAQVEEEVQKQIKAQRGVYAQVVPLGEAKKIHSLRAVFGEVYPDPVRVISIGHPVSDLVSDPENNAWSAYSIEFCGGTHLTNTSEARAFALVEETAVAKGVRRILALTSDAALAALRYGSELQAQLVTLEQLADRDQWSLLSGNQKGSSISVFSSEVDAATISASVKHKIRERIAALNERMKKAHKEMSSGLIVQASAMGDKLAEDARARQQSFIVADLPLGSDNKICNKVLTSMQSKLGESSAVLIISKDDQKKKVSLFAISSSDKVSASEWVNESISVLGGKGGGKAALAQASANYPENGDGSILDAKIEEMKAVAEKFGKMKLGA
eukprot:CAMPEP_0184694834 /NCGR_PEP_ID=MMETSP0313-20130426/2669_1 /TAXON_ID=2792 /ORGANISM="Porphyridium aerugineum, Strain SAG 1380-2" /LENGTH=1011 /DNA_ID=CAMNT_0027153193 /DNA_START=49 /DNA_END=3084 /DNA_ORIENTATION=-